jgi:hypothetical protein
LLGVKVEQGLNVMHIGIKHEMDLVILVFAKIHPIFKRDAGFHDNWLSFEYFSIILHERYFHISGPLEHAFVPLHLWPHANYVEGAGTEWDYLGLLRRNDHV